MKRIIFLTVLLLIFISCSENNPAKNETLTPETQSLKPETTKLLPDLPDVSFNNTDFVFLLTSWWPSTSNLIAFPYVVSETLNGEIVNDAVYMRNTLISEKYGVNIKEIDLTGQDSGGGGIGYQRISKGYMAGDHEYDAGFIGTYDVCTLARDGYLHDLLELPHIDLDKPWWDARVKRDLLIGNKMYFTNGDINIQNNECTYAILFNKRLINDYKLEIPYELVLNNKWTIDKFLSMAKGVSQDLNGDGKWDENDQYGILVWQDSVYGMIVAAGEKIATVIDGKIELTLYNENTVSTLTKYMDFLKDETYSLNIRTLNSGEVNMFANNQALFHTRYISTIKLLRDMETDFGILPYPKLYETQSSYYSNIHGYGDSFVCIPKTAANPEMSAIILEALAAESMYNITPAYYDVTLTGKFFRDDESREMLDIIFSTRGYDVGLFYQVGGYTSTLLEMLNSLRNDFTSVYQKDEAKALQQIDTINQAFSENN
ncbi:MAG: hypothetical protein FWF15_04350 [Oscillospiraceae bacterium]|nr:hypothetical protein [Oscillospiraceae bacterium]